MENTLDKLDNKTPFFSLDGQSFEAKCVKVTDGDTVKLVFKFNEKYCKWNCRIKDINCPEIRTKNLKEKEIGLKAKNFIIKLILNKTVNVKCHKFGSFGRLLVDIFTLDNKNIAKILLDEGLAINYEDRKNHIWG